MIKTGGDWHATGIANNQMRKSKNALIGMRREREKIESRERLDKGKCALIEMGNGREKI